jgi:cytochrome c5
MSPIRPVLVALLGVALLAACSKSDSPAPANSSPAATSEASSQVAAATPGAATADATLEKGEHVYKSTCSMCHATGAGGAPTFKSQADWGPRIAKGKPTLYDHALHGFTGDKGTMPAKGGNASLSDDDVKAGVDYMVSKAQ